MKKFNPNDFKVGPVDQSKLTINGESVEWKRNWRGIWVAKVEELTVLMRDDVVECDDGFKPTFVEGGIVITKVEGYVGEGKLGKSAYSQTVTAESRFPERRAVISKNPEHDDTGTLAVTAGFYLERGCGHCGAPRGVVKVTEEIFDATKGSVVDELQEHNDWEHPYDISDRAVIKSVHNCCAECRSYEL